MGAEIKLDYDQISVSVFCLKVNFPYDFTAITLEGLSNKINSLPDMPKDQ